jgi:hypothetical protein
MARNTTIILSKGGEDERTVRVDDIEIPDLWHLTRDLPKPQQDAIVEVWHLAHDLHRHIIDGQASDPVPETPDEEAQPCS